jgi:hypothetical protein
VEGHRGAGAEDWEGGIGDPPRRGTGR